MIEVDPMPNELVIAHEARIFLANCCASKDEFSLLIANTLKGKGEFGLSLPKLNQLATISSMSGTDYARQHSMLASLRVAAKSDEEKPHGSLEGATFTHRLGLLTQRKGAFVCVHCVQTDLENSPFSWHRRTHHLLGVDWCSTHKTRLARVMAPEPWSQLPQHHVKAGEIETLSACCEEIEESSFLGRFTEIATALLLRPLPFNVQGLGSALANRAQSMGFRICRKGVKRLISDHIRNIAPAEWLLVHFPEVFAKRGGEFLSTIDGQVVSRTMPATGHVYALALTALFDSAEQAMKYVECSTEPERVDALPKVKAQLRRGEGFWQGDFLNVYQQCRGRVSMIAKCLEIDRTYLQEKMTALGYPSLRFVDTDPKWRALVRFKNGTGLAQACKMDKVEISAVENLLRATNPSVVALVQKLLGDFDKNEHINPSEFIDPAKSTQGLKDRKFTADID